MECGDRSRRFASRQPQLPRLRSRQGKAATAVAALQNLYSLVGRGTCNAVSVTPYTIALPLSIVMTTA